MLTLPEELFLLAIDDASGKVCSPSWGSLEYGLAGAILAELALLGKIDLDEGKKLTVQDNSPASNGLLEAALLKISHSKRPHSAKYWVEAIGGDGKWLRSNVVASLVSKGVITEEKKKLLWVIPYSLYPEKDASAKYWSKLHLRGVIFAGDPIDQRSLILLSLLRACQLTNMVFTKDERKAANKQIKQLVKGEIIGEAVSGVIEDIEAATATVIVVTAASS
jgi:golgi phosphoprotein 3